MNTVSQYTIIASINPLHALNQGRTLVSTYVGMARKQDDSSNGCISNYTMITQLGASAIHFEALLYPF